MEQVRGESGGRKAVEARRVDERMGGDGVLAWWWLVEAFTLN